LAILTTQRATVRLLTVAALFVAGLVVPLAHATGSRAVGWIVTRTGNAAEAIEGTLASAAISNESAVLMFATTGTGAHRRLDYRFVTTVEQWGGDAWATVNDDRLPSTECAAACQSPVGFPRTAYVTSNGRALTSTVYIAAYDVANPTLTITSPGWKVRRWVPNWHLLTTSDAEGSTSVTAFHESVGTFRGGQLTGGRYGSVAAAVLPCDFDGAGSITLTGGTRTWPMSCDYVSSAVDGSPKRATWRMTGEITGAGSATDVLIVVDYPR
jgi:hypothetical protein